MKRTAVRRRRRAIARRALYPFVEGCWSLLFCMLGRLLRPTARRWTTSGRERVLVIAPHPDDETLGAGGTIARHVLAGDIVRILTVTDGSASRAFGLSSARMAAQRASEAVAAGLELGIGAQHIVHLRLPEGRWPFEELAARLADALNHLKPTIIYTTSCIDYHPEHIRVASALAEALRRERHMEPLLRLYEVQTPLTPLLVNLISDIGETEVRKRGALLAYRTQRRALGWRRRQARYIRNLYRSPTPLEIFWQLTSSQFNTLTSAGERRKPGVRPLFKGLGGRPLADPLAWLVGLRLRANLRRLSNTPGK